MKSEQKGPQTIDEYIAGFPEDVQAVLQEIRRTVREAAPGAQETIKYQIPTFTLHGNLVYFAAYKKHIGFYPRVPAMDVLKDEIAPYEAGKGSLRFPLDRPVPYDLITRLVNVRVREHLEAERKG